MDSVDQTNHYYNIRINSNYNCSELIISWSGNCRSGNLVVEMENFVSPQAGRHSEHNKPFSNSISTPGSFSSVNNGVHHLTLRKMQNDMNKSVRWFSDKHFWTNTSVSTQTRQMFQRAKFDFDLIFLEKIIIIHRNALT